MKKVFLFISMLLIVTVSLCTAPVMVNAADPTGDQLRDEFVGNLTCGNSAGDTEVIRFHKSLPEFTNRMYDFLKIITPVIIIITGMLDMGKAVIAQKEDEIKKSQKKFVNRLMAGAVVFLVFVIVEFVIAFVADNETKDAMDCVDCFLRDTSSCDIYNISYSGGDYDHEVEACFYCDRSKKYTWGNADTLGRSCTAHKSATTKDACEALN